MFHLVVDYLDFSWGYTVFLRCNWWSERQLCCDQSCRSSSLDDIHFWGTPRILFTWCYTFLGKSQDPPHLMLYLSGDPPGSSSLEAIPFWGNPQDPPHLMLYLSGESPGSSSLDAIPFWVTPRILLTWCYTFLGNPQDPPHLMLYLSGEPPGSSSLDDIPFYGTPGSSSLDDIPFWGIPQNMRKQWWWGWNTDLCSNKDPSGWIDGVNCCILHIWLGISQYVLPASGNLPGIHLNSI